MPEIATPSTLRRGLAEAVEAVARGFDREPVPPRTFLFGTRDGARLEADAFLPRSGRPIAKALVAPAMGVPRRFYAPFAADLAAHGIAALSFDYRGVGGSLAGPVRDSPAVLSEWGEEDLAAATRELAALSVPGATRELPLLFVGHSVGGQLLGLMSDVPYRSALFVGSQAGYFGHWDGASRALMAALWFAAVPALTRVFGYLPMSAFGKGEDIPRGVAREWARWGRDPEYIGVHVRDRPDAGYHRFAGRIRAVSIADDAYAPPRAVAALARLYRAADVEVAPLHPRDEGVAAIGHFGWFKDRFRGTLWADARRWLLASAGVSPGGAGPD
jgi:predicted alpha/beta hydrolase